jgi:hypothetical protein
VTGVFALEAEWTYNDFGRSTVRPMLDLLGHGVDGKLNIAHRDVATREELAHYLGRWAKQSERRFPLLYLGCHGDPGVLYLGDGSRSECESVTLDDLAEMLGPNCKGRIVHFGCCGTLGVDKRRIGRFLRRTGVLAVTGFVDEVDWLRSTAFELLILPTVLRYSRTRKGARRMAAAVHREAGPLRRELGFRVVLNEP